METRAFHRLGDAPARFVAARLAGRGALGASGAMIRFFSAGLLAALAPTAAYAQDVPQATPVPTPTPAPTPTFIPIPDDVPLAEPTPVPIPAPTPTVAPPVRATPPARPIAPAPTPAPTAPEPPADLPIIVPTPTPTAAALPEPTLAPPVRIPQQPAAVAEEESGSPWLLVLAALAGLGALAFFLFRRRREELIYEPEPDFTAEPEFVAPEIVAEPEPVVVPVAPPPARADLTLAFRPTRAGLNMLSATVEGELTVANTGEAAARDVRVRAVLLTAHPGLDANIAALRAEPVARPAAPPFTLGPGETRTLRVVAAAAREALQVLTAGERPMFVPVVAIDLAHAGGQTGQAYAVGVERVDSPKLAPFWLDVPPKSYTEVSARDHGPAFGR